MFRRAILSVKYVSYRFECTKVGFIGLGAMGMDLARRLCEAGTSLVVHDQDKKRMKKAVCFGAACVNSPGEMACECDIIFTIVPDFASILNIIDGPKGILSNTDRKELLFVNLSKIGPVNAQRLHDGFKSVKKISFLSAPAIGTNKLCGESKILFVVSGSKELADKVCKYLKIMSEEKDFMKYVGEQIVDSQSVVMCNIFLSTAIMVAVAETMNLGDKLGLNERMLADILNSADAQSFVGEYYNPMPDVSKFAPSNRDYKDGHNLRIVYKILIIAQDVAARLKAPTPVLSAALQMYNLALSRGFGDLDFSTVMKLYEKTLLPE